MAATQIAYRLFDKNGEKTEKLTARFPFLKKKKFLVQIVGAAAFVLIFGIICLLAGVPLAAYYVISGAFVGTINGMAVTLMCSD